MRQGGGHGKVDDEHQKVGPETSGDSVVDPAVEERAANKGVGGADHLEDLNFLAGVLDVEADGVADDEEGGERKEEGEGDHRPSAEGQEGVEMGEPAGIGVHLRDAGETGVGACEPSHRGRVGGAGRDDDDRRERVGAEEILGVLAESRPAGELSQALTTVEDTDGAHGPGG